MITLSSLLSVSEFTAGNHPCQRYKQCSVSTKNKAETKVHHMYIVSRNDQIYPLVYRIAMTAIHIDILTWLLHSIQHELAKIEIVQRGHISGLGFDLTDLE